MRSEIRTIPTLVGLAILVSGLIAGIILISQRQIFLSQAAQPTTPQNIKIANLEATSASIYWTTEESAIGFVQAGPAPTLDFTYNDDRDTQNINAYRLHFVTLTNLSPDTTYYYKINSAAKTYPGNSPLVFTTPAVLPVTKIPPLVGTVIGNNNQPVSEALAVLDIPGAQPIAAVTRTSGDFVLPLSEVRNSQLSANLDLDASPAAAVLNIYDLQKKSRVTLPIPAQTTLLPAITLGQDLQIKSPALSSKYDLNGDSKVNSLDLSIVIKNLGKKTVVGDFNGDSLVDQKDLTEISNYLIRPGTP